MAVRLPLNLVVPMPRRVTDRGRVSGETVLDPYLDPYGFCLMRLMRLFLVLDERG